MAAPDRNAAFLNAEKLLRSGKVSTALQEFRDLADEAPRDFQMLNRIGDSLARAGRNGEAIAYYERIADQFASAGFYPKAVAIVKKAARLDPDRVEVLVRLGEYNLRQKFVGEAKTHLQRAGDSLVRSGQMERARQVYERLVSADPTDVLNRVRLAEARAALGEAARATEELVAAARQFAESGRTQEAERTFRRALELGPAAPEPAAALASFLAENGRPDEGLELLSRASAERPDDNAVLGEWFVFLEHLERYGESESFLSSRRSDGLSAGAVERALSEAMGRSSAEAFWKRLDPLVQRWIEEKRFEKVTTLLERLARTEAGEHLPALRRLVTAREAEGSPAATARASERLLAALESHGAEREELERLRGRIRELDPASSVVRERDSSEAGSPRPEEVREDSPDPVRTPASESPEEPTAGAKFLRYEAPAVPLSPADHEFVAGHLTEAEVFLKYSLSDEAANQLREIAARFPGHVEALEQLTEVLSSRGEPRERQEILAELAWARRAAGDEQGARAALRSARSLGALSDDIAAVAAHLGLMPDGEDDEETRSARPAASATPAVSSGSSELPQAPTSSDEEWLIEFEADESEVETPISANPRPFAREASSDMIEEIEGLAEQERFDEALRKTEALRILGFGGSDLDRVEEQIRSRSGSAETGNLDEEDLSTLTASLASDLAEAEEEASAPRERDDEDEQSLDEVFDAFKRHVNETVHAEDFRTRYDLGIAYKEMGLVEEALEAFREATRSPELFRDACTMIAICHRERGEIDDAIAWYRRALEGGEEESHELHGIRYDLAEVLMERGDPRAALELFRSVLDADPSYRDVRRYVNELQARAGS